MKARMPMFLIFAITVLFIFPGCPDSDPCTTCPSPNDTTSHDFAWEKVMFGEHSSSVLYDVAIINENDIWCVGEIYLKDSSGQSDPNAYNAVHWNGSNWELKRIPFIGSCSAVDYPSLKAIWAFSSTKILVTNGGSIVTYDGVNATMDCRMNSLLTGALNKVFAINTQSIYAVGNKGTVVYYNGQRWQKVSSGTTLNINDIWGAYNPQTMQYEILYVASNILQSLDKEVLKINGATTQIISKEGIGGVLSSVWFNAGYKYYVAGGGGVYGKDSLNDSAWTNSEYDFTKNFLFRVRGVGINDVTAVGGVGEVLHFNGKSWKSYFEETRLNSGNYYSVAIKNNLIIAVGQDNPKAVVLVGKR